MMKEGFVRRNGWSLLLISLVLAVPFAVHAQRISGYSVATTHQVEGGDVAFGDIISYEKQSGTYYLTTDPNDPSLFGVAAEQPLLVHQTPEGGTPIVQSGVVLVNVISLNGPIAQGDEISASPIPGKGQKAPENTTQVLGIAQASFSGATGTPATTTTGTAITIGKIPVLLTVGEAGAAQKEQSSQGQNFSEATVLNIIQYIVAAFVAIGSVFIAFRNFMPNISRGVAAVGRNPRAKASIQSMVIFNSILIVLISAGGFALAIAIILVPV